MYELVDFLVPAIMCVAAGFFLGYFVVEARTHKDIKNRLRLYGIYRAVLYLAAGAADLFFGTLPFIILLVLSLAESFATTKILYRRKATI